MKKSAIIILALITIITACNSKTQSDVRYQTPIFLTYGEMVPDGYATERDSAVVQKFGFRITQLAGCDVTTVLVDSAATVNKKNDLLMQAKYGKNWQAIFEAETKLKLAIPGI